jgi:hypothetical protein
MTKLLASMANRKPVLISLGLLALAAMTVALMPKGVRADERVPIKGAFAVAASATPNTGGITYCGGRALDTAVEAHGAGYSTLGALSLSLQKTIESAGTAMHGCLTLTAPNGDNLNATYDGTEGPSNANNFNFGTGTLTFTGGTGRFRDASGSAQFTGVFGGIYGQLNPPFNVMAFYSIEGTVFLPEQ